MLAFNCLILLGLLVHLVSSDVSLTIGSNQQNVRSEQTVRSNYQAPRGYDYSGSYSTVAPENKAQYVGSYSTGAPDTKAQYVSSYSTGAPEYKAQYVGSYSTGAPDAKAQYVSSYSTGAPNSKAQYVGSYSTGAPNTNAQYVNSYSTGAPDNKAQYVGSYSTGAPDTNAQYVSSYSTGAPDTKAQYVGSYSTGAPNTNAQYVGSYSTGATDNKAQYVGSYSTGAPDTKAQYVNSYSSGASDNKAQYVGSYSTGGPDNKAQYVNSYSSGAPDNKAQYVTSSSSRSSYDANPSGQISSDRKYYSAKQEYNPQYQNDRGVLLISKELQVPFVASKKNDDSDGCDENDGKENQQVQVDENDQNDEQNNRNVLQNNQNVEQNNQNVENDVPAQAVFKTSKYEVRRPGIRKEFYDIEERVFIKPAGSAIFELQHDKPHTAAIVNKHVYQQQRQQQSYPYPQYPQNPQYPQYSDDDSQYNPQDQQYANHGYNPVIIQSVPSNGYDYNPVHSPPRPHVTYPNTYNYNPGYPSTTVTPQYTPVTPQYTPVTPQYTPVTPQHTPSVAGGYLPPVAGGYLPPCEDIPSTPSKPHPPSSQHELSDEEDDGEHDYDSDAAFISPIKEDNQDFVDVAYAPSKSNTNRDREYYKAPQSSVYTPESRIDRVRLEYQNQRGDLAPQKVVSQYPQHFHQEYVPNVNVNQKQVQIRPNGAPLAKYSQETGSSQVEIQNSQKLLDLYSANGDVTEVGFGGNAKSQQYQNPSNNVRARVVSVTPAPQYANYVDEQSKSRRVVLSKPLYTVQQVEVREHSHRLVEDVQSDSVEPKISEFEKLRLIGTSSGKSTSSQRQADVNREVEYVTPVPQEFAHLRAGSPVPDTLQK